MDPRERIADPLQALRSFMRGQEASLWTALPGTVQSFNAAAMTVVVQPTIQVPIRLPQGGSQWITLPLLVDVPVFFPHGGGHTLTFPVANGDECLVVFSTLCIDNWWLSGTSASVPARTQAELRLHDLSDGFAFVGFNSQPHVIGNISTDSVQLRADDGSTVIDLNAGAMTVTVTAPVSVTLNTPITHCTGAMIVDGLFTYKSGMVGSGGSTSAQITGNIVVTSGNVSADGIDLKTHVHTGVQSGGTSGGPTG